MSSLIPFKKFSKSLVEFNRTRYRNELAQGIFDAMESSNVNRTELAKLLGVNKTRFSYLLSGSKNVTADTLADILLVLGRTPHLTMGTDIESIRFPVDEVQKYAGEQAKHYLETTSSEWRQYDKEEQNPIDPPSESSEEMEASGSMKQSAEEERVHTGDLQLQLNPNIPVTWVDFIQITQMRNSMEQQFYQVSLGSVRLLERQRKEDFRVMIDETTMRSVIRTLCRNAEYYPTEDEAKEG